MVRNIGLLCLFCKSEYFCKRGLTDFQAICPSDGFVESAQQFSLSSPLATTLSAGSAANTRRYRRHPCLDRAHACPLLGANWTPWVQRGSDANDPYATLAATNVQLLSHVCAPGILERQCHSASVKICYRPYFSEKCYMRRAAVICGTVAGVESAALPAERPSTPLRYYRARLARECLKLSTGLWMNQ
jgi:hypothetical protein